MQPLTILVTGATGFIGGHLSARLQAAGHRVRAAVRSASSVAPAGVQCVVVGDIGPETSWDDALEGVEVVIHLASRVHMMNDTAADPLAEFRRINVGGTAALARACVRKGVRRLVFTSSIKVNGEGRERPYTEADPPAPVDPYGVSKMEAEAALRQISVAEKLQVVIVRPPMVYGPGVKGNMRKLLDLAWREARLPLKSIDNRRSMVGVANLADFLTRCASAPEAADQTFLVSDGQDLSTPQIFTILSDAMGRRCRLVPFPVWLMKLAGAVLGKRDVVHRLVGSLQVDINKSQTVLGWTPPYTATEQLAQTARWHLGAGNR